jgi:hypothetical protein
VAVCENVGTRGRFGVAAAAGVGDHVGVKVLTGVTSGRALVEVDPKFGFVAD